MDYTCRERHGEAIYRFKNGMLPSDFFHRNVVLSFQEDAIGIRLRDVIGVDNMMWGSDYPHSESTFPQSRKSWRRSWRACRATNRSRSRAATPPVCSVSTRRGSPPLLEEPTFCGSTTPARRSCSQGRALPVLARHGSGPGRTQSQLGIIPEPGGHETSRKAHVKRPDLGAVRAGLTSIGAVCRMSSAPTPAAAFRHLSVVENARVSRMGGLCDFDFSPVKARILGSAGTERPSRCIGTK
jgi:hypothetical protein